MSMNLDELQNAVKEKYYKYDVKSGHLFLLAVMVEEVGELAEAIRKNDKDAIQEELVDVLFMTLSIANLFDVKLENELVKKYLNGDPSKKWDLPFKD